MGSKAPKIAPNEKHEFYSLYGLEQKKGHWLVDKSKSRRREEEEQREKKRGSGFGEVSKVAL